MQELNPRKAFSKFLSIKGPIRAVDDEEYLAMIDCMCCMGRLLAENDRLRKENNELRQENGRICTNA